MRLGKSVTANLQDFATASQTVGSCYLGYGHMSLNSYVQSLSVS